MAFDLFPAVDEEYKFPDAVREANALTPEFRNQVEPMTETQRNNLSGDELWLHRMVFNTTTTRINRYNGTAWTDLSSEAPGIVKMFAGATAPVGHVLCNGSVVSRTGIYSALFAIVGTTYNVGGETSTEFRLPNLKGKVVVGVDAGQAEFNNLGETGGEKTHVLSEAEMPSHEHSGATGGRSAQHTHAGSAAGVGDHSHAVYMNDKVVLDGPFSGHTTGTVRQYNASPGDNTTGSGAHGHSVSVGGEPEEHTHTIPTAGSDAAHNNLQPYIAMNYIITL